MAQMRLWGPFRTYTAKNAQVVIDRREQCCAANCIPTLGILISISAANYEQVVNHVVPSCSKLLQLNNAVTTC